jgi:hypothetical protein
MDIPVMVGHTNESSLEAYGQIKIKIKIKIVLVTIMSNSNWIHISY